MQITMKEREGNRLWVGAPKLEKVMGIDHGLVVLRSKNRELLNKLVATALLKNYNPDTQTFYLYAAPDFLNGYADFISTTSKALNLDQEMLMNTAHFVNASTASPMKLEQLWTRVAETAERAGLFVLDSVGYHAGRDAYLIDQLNKFCYYKNALALILDSSEELDPTLERLAAVVVDLDVRGEGIEVFLRKHPRLPQTVFLMSA